MAVWATAFRALSTTVCSARTCRAPCCSNRSSSRSVIDWVRPEALAYFKSRLTQAPRDSQQGLRVVLTHCTTVEMQQRAFAALAFKLELLWVMIDTIHHAYLEPRGA